MKVLIVGRPLTGLRGLGVERYTQQLVSGLRKAKIDCDFTGEFKLIKFKPLCDLMIFLYVIFSRVRYNIIHFTDYPLALISPLCFSKTRLIVTCHHTNVPPLTSFREKMFTRILTQKLYKLILKVVIRFTSLIIAVSSQTASEVKEKFPRANVSVVNSPVKLIPSIQRVNKYNNLTLGFLGGLLPAKRPDIAVNILNKLKSHGLDVRLWICGDGYLLEDLKEYVKKLGLEFNTIFLGHQDDKHLPWFYNKLDFLLFTSSYEGFGYPVIEAASCGTIPIIIPFGITEEVYKVGMPVFSEDEAVKRIIELYKDKVKYDVMSEVCRRRALNFSTEKSVEKMICLYEKLRR